MQQVLHCPEIIENLLKVVDQWGIIVHVLLMLHPETSLC
jgi:hypothetical protein